MFTSTLTAQNRSRRMNIEDYEKRKMEFIKTQAGLTNSEAEKYFPLNSELTKKKFNGISKETEKPFLLELFSQRKKKTILTSKK
jgi:hypothetical protein